jgi:hypothetical protein
LRILQQNVEAQGADLFRAALATSDDVGCWFPEKWSLDRFFEKVLSVVEFFESNTISGVQTAKSACGDNHRRIGKRV